MSHQMAAGAVRSERSSNHTQKNVAQTFAAAAAAAAAKKGYGKGVQREGKPHHAPHTAWHVTTVQEAPSLQRTENVSAAVPRDPSVCHVTTALPMIRLAAPRSPATHTKAHSRIDMSPPALMYTGRNTTVRMKRSSMRITYSTGNM